jgi:methanogenic corrinoid protein MtbC1
MRDSHHGGPGERGSGSSAVLARTVVARLLAREGAADRPVDAAIVAALARALIAPDLAPIESLRLELRRSRITETEFVDSYFPAVARYLGCAWAEDSAPFTDVTIAVARMQAMLRQIGQDWTSNAVAEAGSSTVLVVLPEGEQHSFGAILLAGQLRRQGISVRLEIGTPASTLRKLAHEKSYDCAMISIACEEAVDRCRAVVKALKEGSGGRLWVAVGGTLLDQPIDLRDRTGADVVTNDPLLALQGALAAQSTVKGFLG